MIELVRARLPLLVTAGVLAGLAGAHAASGPLYKGSAKTLLPSIKESKYANRTDLKKVGGTDSPDPYSLDADGDGWGCEPTDS